MTLLQEKLLENKVRKIYKQILNEETFNIDRTKNIIGNEVYTSIKNADEKQLRAWLKNLEGELETEKRGSVRYNKLTHEKQLIKYRLEERVRKIKKILNEAEYDVTSIDNRLKNLNDFFKAMVQYSQNKEKNLDTDFVIKALEQQIQLLKRYK
jgi:DNA repair ATPase RecN